MQVIAIKTRVFRENGDLLAFVCRHVPVLKNGSILAVTSKVVALAEGRTAAVSQKEALIKKESAWAVRTHKKWWWTEKDGQLLVNAGIDESNGAGKLVLLPRDSYSSASSLRQKLMKHYRIRKLGVVITDSRISPMRRGVTALALGYAGFRGVRDYRGKPDVFGKRLQVTMTDVADSVATAAALVMGEGKERQPLAVIEGAPVQFIARVDRGEVRIPAKDDMYRAMMRVPKRR